MKKRKLNLLIMLLILATGFSSCVKVGDSLDKGLYIEIGNIYGKIENASKYSNVVEIKLVVSSKDFGTVELASGKRKNGGFTIEPPKTLDPNYLHTFIDNEREYMTIIDPPPTVTISNENVKIGNAKFFGVDKNGNVVTRFYPIEIDEDDDGSERDKGQDVYYTYVDSDVSISGYSEREHSALAPTEYDNARDKGMTIMRPMWNKITTSYSVEWKKGWNVWSFSRFCSSLWVGEEGTENWSTTLTGTLVWYSEEDLWSGSHEEIK